MARISRLLLACMVALLILGTRGAQADVTPIKIMPLGDSITSTIPGQASYRYWLYKQVVAAGYAVDFVGSLWGVYQDPDTTPLYPDFDADHEGWFGYRTDQVRDNITAWATEAQPDVVLIHLGHNDLWNHESIDSTIIELGQVIDKLRAVNSNVKILLAKLIPSSAGGELDRIPLLNARIPALAASKNIPTSPPVRVVDQYLGFDPVADTVVDGVHPDESGEKKMAERWFGALNIMMRGHPAAYLPVVYR